MSKFNRVDEALLPYFYRMTIRSTVLLSCIIFLAPGCLPTLSTNFETARMLASKTWEVQGNCSSYQGVLNSSKLAEWGNKTNNYGLSVAYGLTSKIRLRARFENIVLKDRAEFFNGPILPPGSRVQYSEFGIKFGWNQHRKMRAAFSLPLGIITHQEETFGYITPTLYASYARNDKFEVGVNGKVHYWFHGSTAVPWVSTGIVFGLSQNLKKWALRTEINSDIYNISLGIGFSYLISPFKTR